MAPMTQTLLAPSAPVPVAAPSSLPDEATCWQAVQDRDRRFGGVPPHANGGSPS